jgi:8-oxo-dGTP diphosphatase
MAPMSSETSSTRQRVAAYGLARDQGRVLLVRASELSNVPGTWFLPGGGIEFGEAPDVALQREVTEETGYVCDVGPLETVVSDVCEIHLPAPEQIHTIRMIYRIKLSSGEGRPEKNGSSDAFEWVLLEEVAALPLAPFVRALLVPDGA